jgi:hypothetical protein
MVRLFSRKATRAESPASYTSTPGGSIRVVRVGSIRYKTRMNKAEISTDMVLLFFTTSSRSLAVIAQIRRACSRQALLLSGFLGDGMFFIVIYPIIIFGIYQISQENSENRGCGFCPHPLFSGFLYFNCTTLYISNSI